MMTLSRYAFPVRRELLDAQPAEPLQRRAPRVVHGPKPCNGCPASKEPDWVILEVRRAHAAGGLALRNIPPHMAGLGVEITKERVRQILTYQSRGHLEPAPGRVVPYGPTEQSGIRVSTTIEA